MLLKKRNTLKTQMGEKSQWVSILMWTGSQRPEFKDTPEIRPVHFAEMSSQKSKMLLSSLYGSDVLMPDNIGAPNEANGVLGDLFPDVHQVCSCSQTWWRSMD